MDPNLQFSNVRYPTYHVKVIFFSSKKMVGLSIKIHSMVKISADLKPELSMILEAFILSRILTHTNSMNSSS